MPRFHLHPVLRSRGRSVQLAGAVSSPRFVGPGPGKSPRMPALSPNELGGALKQEPAVSELG